MKQLIITLLFTAFFAFSQAQTTATFENFGLMPGEYLNNSQAAGGFESGNIFLPNSYSGGFWSGWAISATTDVTTPGFQNEYSAIAGGGANGSSTYSVTYIFGQSTLRLKADAAGGTVEGMYVTNNTYAYLSMLDGDAFAKKFGGEDGNDPDFFLLTIKKYLNGQLGQDSIDFYLADYRFSDNSQDYIVKEWTYLDLSTLGPADSLWFGLTSSDVGLFGMNTPAYFCMDDVTTSDASSTEIGQQADFSLYPNPASNYLIIEGAIQDEYAVYDILGNEIAAGNITNNKIDLNNWQPGHYIIYFKKQGRAYTFSKK
jgi:hypothetical protein